MASLKQMIKDRYADPKKPRKEPSVCEAFVHRGDDDWKKSQRVENAMLDHMDRAVKFEMLLDRYNDLLDGIVDEKNAHLIYKSASPMAAKLNVAMMVMADKDSDKLSAMKAVQDRAMGKPVERRIEASVIMDMSEAEVDNELAIFAEDIESLVGGEAEVIDLVEGEEEVEGGE